MFGRVIFKSQILSEKDHCGLEMRRGKIKMKKKET
jgi:hypothetical protein